MLTLAEKNWGDENGQAITLYSVEDSESKFLVEVSNYGATLVRVKVADRDGNVEDVNFGQAEFSLFRSEGAYLGAVVGRVANRISDGIFTLEGKNYTLLKNNNGKHALHGGKDGFTYRVWNLIEKTTSDTKIELTFEYLSQDGEEGYPGELSVLCKYIIESNVVAWEFSAHTKQTTIINMTNHAYWNLESPDSLVDDHELQINSEEFMVGDEDNLVTGEIKNVKGTGLNFLESKLVKDAFAKFGDIDNNFFLKGYQENKLHKTPIFAAELYSPKSGRVMTVETTEPCIQIYTGNYLEGVHSFGKTLKKHSAICLETQRVPNAIKIPEYSDTVILKPGEEYFHKTVHKFSVK